MPDLRHPLRYPHGYSPGHPLPGRRFPRGLPPHLQDVQRCLVMGVLNVTPDSFSDGGLWLDTGAAIRQAQAMMEAGADLIDVGGESTRPGAVRVDPDQEQARVLPVVRGLVALGIPVSIDTSRAQTARAALDAGAVLVNDVSGGQGDPAMGELLAATGAPVVVMHWRGPSDVMDSLARYDDVVAEVCAELLAQVDRVVAAGVSRESVVIDPGFGFAKSAEHNWRLLGSLPEVVALGFPVLVGTARKRFLAQAVTASEQVQAQRGPAIRDAATAATTTLAALAGAWAVRVHDVAASADAVRVVAHAAAQVDTAAQPDAAAQPDTSATRGSGIAP